MVVAVFRESFPSRFCHAVYWQSAKAEVKCFLNLFSCAPSISVVQIE